MRLVCVVGLFFLAAAPALAESPHAVAGFTISPAGHVITKKALADCKRQARVRKLNYIRQRDFIRKCAGP